MKRSPNLSSKKRKSHKIGTNYLLIGAILLLAVGLFFCVEKSVFNVLARSVGNSFDAGKWGKKATDTQTTRDITPTPSPQMSISEDSVLPTVHINFPIDGSTHSTYLIFIRASANDNIGISHVNFYVNGVLKYVDTIPEDVYDSPISQNNVPGLEYGYTWTPPTSGTTYVIEAHAYDLAGNYAIDKIQVSTYGSNK